MPKTQEARPALPPPAARRWSRAVAAGAAAAFLTFLVVPGADAAPPLQAGDLVLDVTLGNDTRAPLTPWGTAVDSLGRVHVVDRDRHRVLRVDPDGTTVVVAGTGRAGDPVPGPATASPLDSPIGIAFDDDDTLYVADWGNHQVERITADGALSVVAGTGTAAPPLDGAPATSSPLNHPTGVAVGPDGSVYVADQGNNRVERFVPGGTLTVVAGTGRGGSPTPGPATSSKLFNPAGVAVDSRGNVYVADQSAQRIERVDPRGELSFFAGTGSTGAPRAGRATSSPVPYPYGVAVDAQDRVLVVSDAVQNVLRIDAAGDLTTISGTGTRGRPVPGRATESPLDGPRSVAVARDGTIHVADTGNGLLERLRPAAAPVLSTVLPPATVGLPYRAVLSATGVPAARVSIVGTLPDGLSFDAAQGAVTGTPSAVGSWPVELVATNDVGEDRAGAVIAVRAGVPGAPGTVTALAGNGFADVSWTPPTEDGGDPVTDYVLEVRRGGVVVSRTTLPAGTTAVRVPDLENGSAHSFVVSARNTAGEGAGTSSPVVTPSAPPPPVVVTPVPVPTLPVAAPVLPGTAAPVPLVPVVVAVVPPVPPPSAAEPAAPVPTPPGPAAPGPRPTPSPLPGPAVGADRSPGGLALPVPPRAGDTAVSSVLPTPADPAPVGPAPDGPTAVVTGPAPGPRTSAAAAPAPGAPRAEPPGSSGRGGNLAAAAEVLTRVADQAAGVAVTTLAVARTAVTRNPQFPASLVAFAVVFLLVQTRIDRNDPKLAGAALFGEPDVPFVGEGPGTASRRRGARR